MEPKLIRVDYLQVGLTARNTLKVLKVTPESEEEMTTVPLIIGDQTGSLHHFVVKPESANIQTVFRTLPGPNAKISAIETIYTSNAMKIMVAQGSSIVKGYNKKGKQFFGLELNNLTEPIKNFRVNWPNEIYITGQYIFNGYHIDSDGQGPDRGTIVNSKNYYVCPEKIIDLTLLQDRARRRVVPMLACQDRILRILNDSRCVYEVELAGIPSAVVQGPPMETYTTGTFVLYGTLDGKVSLITIDFKSTEDPEPTHRWDLPTLMGDPRASRSAVNCLELSDQAQELFIGRADGNIEIWAFNEIINDQGQDAVDLDSPPTLRINFNCSESITSIAYCVSLNFLVCATFNGTVFGLVRLDMSEMGSRAVARQRVTAAGSSGADGQIAISSDTAHRLACLREECGELEQKLNMERSRYHQLTSVDAARQPQASRAGEDGPALVSALPYFAINDSFILQEDANYLMTIETEVPIDVVIIQSDIEIDLIDTERNSAVVSQQTSSAAQHVVGLGQDQSVKQVLATFRCQANTTRLELKIRSIEGQFGVLRAYVATRISPKSAILKLFTIKPLSLHMRHHASARSMTELTATLSSDQHHQMHGGAGHRQSFQSGSSLEYDLYMPATLQPSTRVGPEKSGFLPIEKWNTLIISGGFSMNEGHAWIQLCLPEVPERLTESNEAVFKYISTLTGTTLIVSLRRGELRFMSDSVSTISILKDFITREATKKSVQIGMQVNVSESSLGSVLRGLFPLVRALVGIKQRERLAAAARDLAGSDPEVGNAILKELEALNLKDREVIGTKNHSLDRLHGLITDLFIDYIKLNGGTGHDGGGPSPASGGGVSAVVKDKIPNQIGQLEQHCTQPGYTVDEFISELYAFWGLNVK